MKTKITDYDANFINSLTKSGWSLKDAVFMALQAEIMVNNKIEAA